jgi:hypothetical protein
MIDNSRVRDFLWINFRDFTKFIRTKQDFELVNIAQSLIATNIDIDNFGRNSVKVKIKDVNTLKRIRAIKKALNARNKTRKKVKDCCATVNGKPYSATSGWWVIPMVTENKTIGLVNIAYGVALDTGVKLSNSEILENSFAVKTLASGNLASEAHVATFPKGWRQLACDSRDGQTFDVDEYMPKAKIVFTELMTCYGSIGKPIDCFETACGWRREKPSKFVKF